MKKENIKKVVAGIMIATLNLVAFGTTTISAQNTNSNVVLPSNIAITAMNNSLSLGSVDKLSCYGKTSVQSGYTAEVVVELQQKDGGWNTIKTWSNSGSPFAIVDEDRYVSKGYSYRLKLTHKAYNSRGTQVESITKYSETVKCD